MPKSKEPKEDVKKEKKEKKSEHKEVAFSKRTQIRHLEQDIAKFKQDQEELGKVIQAHEHEKNTISASNLPLFKESILEIIQEQIDGLKEDVALLIDDMKDAEEELQEVRRNNH